MPIVSGGASVRQQSATLTTSPTTFTVSHTFDLTRISACQVRFTVTVLTPDGETFGGANGDIGVGLSTTDASLDNSIFHASTIGALAALSNIDASGYAVALGQYELLGVLTPRYVRAQVAIFDVQGGTVYAGANHPTAAFVLDVTY